MYQMVTSFIGSDSHHPSIDQGLPSAEKFNMVEYESPTMTVTKGTIQGWLRKTQQEEKFFRSFPLRYFVFDRVNGRLQVFDKIGGKCSKKITVADVIQCEEHDNLDQITATRGQIDLPTDYTFCFTFMTRTFSFLLWAVSAEERKMWVASVKSLVSPTSESEHQAAAKACEQHFPNQLRQRLVAKSLERNSWTQQAILKQQKTATIRAEYLEREEVDGFIQYHSPTFKLKRTCVEGCVMKQNKNSLFNPLGRRYILIYFEGDTPQMYLSNDANHQERTRIFQFYQIQKCETINTSACNTATKLKAAQQEPKFNYGFKVTFLEGFTLKFSVLTLLAINEQERDQWARIFNLIIQMNNKKVQIGSTNPFDFEKDQAIHQQPAKQQVNREPPFITLTNCNIQNLVIQISPDQAKSFITSNLVRQEGKQLTKWCEQESSVPMEHGTDRFDLGTSESTQQQPQLQPQPQPQPQPQSVLKLVQQPAEIKKPQSVRKFRIKQLATNHSTSEASAAQTLPRSDHLKQFQVRSSKNLENMFYSKPEHVQDYQTQVQHLNDTFSIPFERKKTVRIKQKANQTLLFDSKSYLNYTSSHTTFEQLLIKERDPKFLDRLFYITDDRKPLQIVSPMVSEKIVDWDTQSPKKEDLPFVSKVSHVESVGCGYLVQGFERRATKPVVKDECDYEWD